MKRLIYIVILFFVFSLTNLNVYAAETNTVNTNNTGFESIKITAPSALVMDAVSGRVLFQKDGYSKRSIASLTKILTAIVVVENVNLDEIVEVKTSSGAIGGSTIGMKKGDKISVRSLMYGMLMESGNDCAVALAEYVGGGIDEFAVMMTDKAKKIGAKGSSFANPHGLDNEKHYSTAYDIALIASYAIKNKYINEIVGTNSITVRFGKADKIFSNTNRLLRTYSPADGIKTGFTNGANRCVLASGSNGDTRIIAVILGAETTDKRFDEAKKLLDYGLQNYELKDISKLMNWYINIPIYKGKEKYYSRYISKEMKVAITKSEEEKLYINQRLNPVISVPMKKGNIIGNIDIMIGNETIYTETIYLDKDIYKNSVGDYFVSGVKNMLKTKLNLG